MSSSFKDFARNPFLLPGNMVSGLFGLVFGSTDTDLTTKDLHGQPVKTTSPGLLGLILKSVKDIGLAITAFIADHKKAISIAFWSSLALAGAAALTVAFLPAALTAVTTFTINGYSIAGLVGAEFAAQVGAVAAVAAFAASTAVYTAAAVANTINTIIGLFPAKSSAVSDNKASPTKQDPTPSSYQVMSESGVNSQKHQNPPVEKNSEAPSIHRNPIAPVTDAPAAKASAASAAPAPGK